jgi:hypothetical protein
MKKFKSKLYHPHGDYKLLYGNTYKWVSDFDDGKKLPEGWVKAYSATQGRYYYLNTDTNETQNKKPLFGQNHYSPQTFRLELEKPMMSEIFDGDSYIRTLSSDRYVNETPIDEDGRKIYRSRSGEKTYFDNLPRIAREPTETILIKEICCDGNYTQFPSRLCGESYSHTLAAHASYLFNTEDQSLDGFVEVRNEKANRDCPIYHSIDFIRKKDTVIGYRRTAAKWFGFASPVEVQDADHNLSDHDAIILNLQFRTTQGYMPFNIISMNLEGLCKRTEADPYRHIDYMNLYFSPHIRTGTIMVFQEVVLKDLATTVYKKERETDDGVVDIRDVLAVDEAGDQILQVLQKANPEIPLEFRSDTYTSGILYDTSVWDILDTKAIQRLYHGKLQSKFSNAYLFQSKDRSCIFWVVNIHLKAPFNTSEHIADFNEQISISTGRLHKSHASHHVTNMHITELNNIVGTLNEASNNFEIPVYLCGDYNNDISKGYLVKRAIERLDDFYDPTGVNL